MKSMTVLALMLALTGCAGESQWSKDGTSPEMAARDLSDCEEVAQEATRRDTNINADILASRGHDWQTTGSLATHKANYAAIDRDQSGDIVTRCMIGKGYAPGA